MASERRRELRRRRTRRQKLAKLRRRFQQSTAEAERTAVLRKVFRVAPWLAPELQQQARAAVGASRPPTTDAARRRPPAARPARPKAAEGQPEPAAE